MSLADDFDAIGASQKKGAAPATATASAPAAASGPSAPGSLADQFDSTPTTTAKAPTPKPDASQPHDTMPMDILGGAVEPVATMVTGGIGNLVGGIARLGSAALGNSYDDAKATGNKVADALTYHPMTQGGQQALAGLGNMATSAKNAIMNTSAGQAAAAVGKAYDNTFVKGAPNALMATINDQVPTITANVVAPEALGALKAAPNALREAIAGPAAAAERVEPSMGAQAAPQAAPKATPQPAGAAPNAAPQGATLRGVGAAEANLNPYGSLTGEEASRNGSSAFPQVKVAKNAGDVAPDEQVVRAQIANQILGPDNDAVRTGVITGNEGTLRSEYLNAKSADGTPQQVALRDQIAREQQALSNYAQQRVEQTGANPNLINNEQRGQVIADAVTGEGGLNDYLQQAKQQIYDQARAESGDNPIQTSHVDALLSDPQFIAEAERAGNGRVVNGVTQLIDLARNTGFRDPITNEITSPSSVGAWDAVRKSNNADWNEGNARTIGAINRAIDQDIASAAGSDAYKLGDAIHQAQQNITGARGFQKIFGDADSNGVKQGAAVEQIPDRLNNMPLDQWRHIYNTLDDLSRGQLSGAPEGMPAIPQELQQAAAAARNEMSGSLAREVYEQGSGKAGAWNQNSVNKTLNSVVGQKIIQTFPPDEVAAFHTLNYGGQIMPGVHSYEGAALQANRLDKPGFIEKYGPGSAYIAGAKVGGPIGGWAAEKTANVLVGKLKGNRLQSQGNQLMDAMRANSSLGKN